MASALIPAATCLAWGRDGHRIVAAICGHYLTPEARAGVEFLLGPQSLADVANWADEIRDVPAYRWADPLHYVNVPPDADGFDLDRDCPREGCVVAAILHYTGVLRNREASTAERIEALKFVVHFVADAHQPLHVSLARDRGGNTIRVTLFGEPMTLHEVWDSGLIARANKPWQEYARELHDAITPAQLARWSADPPARWATESFRLAMRRAYPVPPDGRLDREYFDRGIAVVNRRLSAAGVRLAATLNAALRDDPPRVRGPWSTSAPASAPATATTRPR